ncbi:hypothetical protein G9447_19065 [Actinopolyspora sp. BKK1]|nr:hypothetical protein [Actinopolyspora sp. BKK2]NHE78298.1 hypothetical protein [Actinopolyspora sp. BKK1]
MSESSQVVPRPMDITIAESVVRTATGSTDSALVDEIALVLYRHSAFSSELADSAGRGLLSAEEVTEVSARAHAATEREIQRVLDTAVREEQHPVTPSPRKQPVVETYETGSRGSSRTAATMLGVHP